MTTAPRQRGLTLIELMTTIAIIAILAAIAFPLYDSQSRKGKRSDGITLLEMVAQAEHRYRRDNGTFITDVTKLNEISSATSTGGFYSVTVTPGPSGIVDSFIATVTPLGTQANDACQAFTLTHTGVRGGVPDRQTCWGQN